MLEDVIMNTTTTITNDERELLKPLDKGIDDMEAGRLTPHDESMKILRQQLKDYVLQHQGN